MKTPGVYVEEISAFPDSMLQIPTSVAAFVGYTQFAKRGKKSLELIPTRISSIAEYRKWFGEEHTSMFELIAVESGSSSDIQLDYAKYDSPSINIERRYDLEQHTPTYRLYASLVMFFQNGGQDCYVVSVGNYQDDIKKEVLLEGLTLLDKENKPTQVVIPEAVSLPASECYALQQKLMSHCDKRKDRFTILDIHNGFQDTQDAVVAFRNGISNQKGGEASAAYHPWLNTTVFTDNDLSFENLTQTARGELQTILEEHLDVSNEKVKCAIDELVIDKTPSKLQFTPHELDTLFTSISPAYAAIIKGIKRKLNLLPPSSSMAGLFAMTDLTEGVWKAPANISVASVVSPALPISHEQQELLNSDINGQSINAIRKFPSRGTLVWGARTLDSNSTDWRYVNVRRTFIMLEQSIQNAMKAFVFEPNDANTWMTLEHLISNFLSRIYRQGGLAGASEIDAFSVQIGLNKTMTPDDIQQRILRVSVMVAPSRPAEFIVLNLHQKQAE